MKLTKQLLVILLSLLFVLCGLFSGFALGGEPPHQHDGSDDYPPEFVSAVIAIIGENWQDNYFSSITMTIEEDKLTIDGQEVEAAPATLENGELILPLADIARAIGDEDGDSIYGDTIMDIEAAIAPPFVRSPRKSNKDFATKAETERALNVSIQSYGDFITITKPYQTKELIVQTKGNIKLRNTFGAIQAVDNGNGLHFLQYASEESARRARELFDADSSVEYAEPNSVFSLCSAYSVETQVLEDNNYLTSYGDMYVASAGVQASSSDQLHLPNRWGAERIGADSFINYLYDHGKTNEELLVAVVDTGIAADHPFFQGRIRTDLGWNFCENNNYTYDGGNRYNGHGTHVSGIIADCTPSNVKIIPIKIFSDAGWSATTIQISAGIVYAAKTVGAKVINMSFGGRPNEKSPTMQKAINCATNKYGAVCVAAAGNDLSNAADYDPAGFDNVITVAALDSYDPDNREWLIKYDTARNDSNYGNAIDVAAPGSFIESSMPGGVYGKKSGTSMAAAYVSAAAAMLILEYPNYSPKDIQDKIEEITVDLGEPGKDVKYGAGVLDFRKFFGTYVPVTGVKFYYSVSEKKYLVLKPGDMHPLNIVVEPIDSTDKSFKFEIDDESVAVYWTEAAYGNGAVVGIEKGKTKITVTTTDNGKTSFCYITVGENWIDFAADDYAGGTGTEGDPYLIATAEQLAKLAKEVRGGNVYFDKYFKLTNDIDLSANLWTPIVYISNNVVSEGFQGIFDGNGHVVINMDISLNEAQGTQPAGLFGMIGKNSNDYFEVSKKAEIKNLAVLDANIQVNPNHGAGVGILCGEAFSGVSISNCYVSGFCSPNIYGFSGGLIGRLYTTSTISNCYSIINKDADTDSYPGLSTGGFVGTNIGGNICNSYSSGSASVGFAFEQYVFSPYNAITVNSFSTVIATSGYGFMNTKRNGEVKNCYYLSTPPEQEQDGIATDINFYLTNLNPKPLSFFKDINSYTNPANWDSQYPWDFNNVWGIDPNINDGLPYLRIFENKPPGTTTYTGRIKSHIPSLEVNVVLFDSSGKTEICSAKTNKDGDYTLTVPASAPAGEKYILKVTKPGYLPCTVTNVTLNKGEGLKTIDISPFGGDLNGDGYITMDEVLLLMQLAVDEYYSCDHNIYPYVDVYKDEYGIPRVTMGDVVSASRAAVGALEDIDYEKIK